MKISASFHFTNQNEMLKENDLCFFKNYNRLALFLSKYPHLIGWLQLICCEVVSTCVTESFAPKKRGCATVTSAFQPASLTMAIFVDFPNKSSIIKVKSMEVHSVIDKRNLERERKVFEVDDLIVFLFLFVVKSSLVVSRTFCLN